MTTDARQTSVDDGWRGFAYASTDADGWTTFWRLDPRCEPLELADWHFWPQRAEWGHPIAPLWGRARTPAGIYGRWKVQARAVELEVRAGAGVDEELGQVDVLADGLLVHRQQMTDGEQLVRAELPTGTSAVSIWLPQVGAAEVRGPQFDGQARPIPAEAFRWATYGSSITQCAQAAGPSEAWPAIVARRLDWGLRAMGFGGECHLDPAALRELTCRPYDLVSMCLGINIHGAESFSGRTLPGQVATFLGSVVQAQPDARIVVMTPIAATSERESQRNALGLTLGDVRTCVRMGVEAVNRQAGDRVRLLDGLMILGHGEAGDYLGDEVHPTPDGYRLMGGHLTRALNEIVLGP